MTDEPDARRRAFLRGSAVLAPAALVASVVHAQERPRKDDLLLSDPGPDRPADPQYKPAFFTPAEWAFVNAACDRLIPRDKVGPGAVELGVPEYIDRQMLTPYSAGGGMYMSGPFLKAAPEFGYQSKLTPREQYRLGIRAVDAHCTQAFGRSFADLSLEQQDDTLKKIQSGQIVSDEIALGTFFASFLLKNTREGYFGDPMYGGNKGMGSWKMIGYPGVRADYQDWVDRYGERYPYGPVSLHGRQG
ncbi:MAG: gluconate 2-dehydrogenase subunit 3 family protein [Janthinobacterium lividum]